MKIIVPVLAFLLTHTGPATSHGAEGGSSDSPVSRVGAAIDNVLPGNLAAFDPSEAGVSVVGVAIDNVLPNLNGLLQIVGAEAQLAEAALPPVNLGAFQIVIVPGAGLAANAPALAAFTRAADAWEARISDPIIITLNADLGSLGSGIIGSTSSVVLQAGYNTVRNLLVTDSSNEPDDTIVGSLPTAAQFSAFLPAGGTLGSQIIGTKANFKAMGFANLDTSFGVSDGTITFNSTFSFDFDNSNGVGGGLTDFETVAAHEIGHALGFISIVDSVNAGLLSGISPLVLDLYRFSNNVAGEDPANAGEFTSFPRDLIPGEDTVSDFILDPASEFRMSTGTTPSTFPGADGRQASHWKADELSTVFIGLLDPTLASGQFYGPQDPDFRAMDLIGYEIITVPEPSTLSILLVGAMTFGATRRRRG